jgi:hypothetical protein
MLSCESALYRQRSIGKRCDRDNLATAQPWKRRHTCREKHTMPFCEER